MKTRGLLILALFTILSLMTAMPAAADGSAFWTGEYYNNTTFSAPTVMARTDNTIAFNWGAGSPGLGVNTDNFTVRWTASVFLNQGTYRFWALADDNIRVTVDYGAQVVIDTFNSAGVGQTVSRDVYLSFGVHQMTVEYRELGGNAYAYVAWADVATNPTGPNFPGAVPPPVNQPPVIPTTQWLVQYYNNPNLNGQPISIQSDVSPTHNWGQGAPAVGVPADNFSARWSGQVTTNGSPYRLSVRADDGVRVYIDGVLLINEWHGATNQTYSVDLNLPGGLHNVIVEYYDATAEAYLSYALDSLIPGSIPTSIAPPPGAPGYTGEWLAYYFNNTSLTDTPVVIQTELSPSHNWGGSAPLPNVSADNFSVRWTAVQTLAAGNYRVSVRADDGVRVYIDGVLVINEWHNAGAQAYTYDVNLPAGPHTFNIEYYEAAGNAFLDYTLGAATPATPAPTALPNGVSEPRDTGAVATVGLYKVNVRSLPTTTGSTVIAKINPGESYTVMGRTDDSTWWQISVNGQLGWVFSNYVNTYNTANVPITYRANAAQTANTGYTVTATTNLIIRSGPGTSFALLGNLLNGRSAAVVGRNTRSTWYQINYNGVVGWVTASGVQLQGSATTSPIPITG
jgi:uncharacterized protein YraI